MKKKIAAFLCAAVMFMPCLSISADYEEGNLYETITDAVEWKDSYDNPFYSIGTNSSNLYITALRRLGTSYDYASYLNGLNGIAAGYGAEHNAADMQRTVLAVISAYGDAKNVGGRDLVADSTYNRDASAPLSKDGCDGLSWALIALEAGGYEVPENASENRDAITASLLSCQNSDGSFGNGVFSTAAAVTALAPYVETSGAYTVTMQQTGQTIDITPFEAVENAVVYLSEVQMRDGGWGDSKSTAMTVIALDSLGVDCETNPYFSARGGNAVDGLMTYRNNDGGFSYEGGESDGESTSYALCALVSHLGRKQGCSGFFRLNTGDTVSPAAPAPTPEPTPEPEATPEPTPEPSQSNNNTATETPAATVRPAATARPAATVRPSATLRPSVTPRPVPQNTMRPTRTAAPAPSISPSASSSPRPTLSPIPRPTRRPALVGPMEIPGPMPTESPSPDIRGNENGSTMHRSGAGTVTAIVLSAIALLLIASYITLTALKKKGKLKSDTFFGKLMGVKPQPKEKEPARAHRRTEERRKFEQRERYKERLKYRHRT